MNVGGSIARLTNEYARLRLRVRPELVARDANRPLSMPVDQDHTTARPPVRRSTIAAHGVSRQKRAKPPCFITLQWRAVAFPLRAAAATPPTSPKARGTGL